MREIYGYVRVSTKEQKEDRQVIAMEEISIPAKNIYMDKLSGKDFNRPMYKKLLKKLKENDLLYIKSIDRLGRNYEEILEQWRIITKEKKADIVVMDMPLLDTRKGKDLLGTLIADLVLTLLSYVGENERSNIKSRQREGIEAAKLRGVHMGRPNKEMPEDFDDIFDAWMRGEITAKEAAMMCNVSKTTFYNKTKERRELRELEKKND